MNNLKKLRKAKGVTQQEIADFLGVARTAYGHYETGKRSLSGETLAKLSEYFGVSTDEILGIGEERPNLTNFDIDDPKFEPKVLIRTPLPDLQHETSGIPILGSVRAGYDYVAEQEMLGFLGVEESFFELHPEAYALYVKGDSMTPELRHGDIVICLPDQEIRSNDVAVICVNGDEGTVKRVIFEDHGLTLVPANPRYKSIHYSAKDLETIPVMLRGKVVEVRHKYH